MPKAIGPVTVEVAPGRPEEGGRPGVSPTYRNKSSVDGLPTTFNGCATLYELFNNTVEQYGENRRGAGGARARGGRGASPTEDFSTARRGREAARRGL